MSIEYLSNVGNRLVKRCDTRNPFEIAENLGIKIMMVDDFKRLKAYTESSSVIVGFS